MFVANEERESFRLLPGAVPPTRPVVGEAARSVAEETESPLDKFASLAAALLDAPAAQLTLAGSDQQVHLGGAEPAPCVEPWLTPSSKNSMSHFQGDGVEPTVICDTRTDPRSMNGADRLSDTILAYIGVRLMTRDGQVLGSLCVTDRRPRQWTREHVLRLRELARLVSHDVEGRLMAGRSPARHGQSRLLEDEVHALQDAVWGLVELAEQHDEPRFQRHAAAARVRLRAVAAATAALQRAPQTPSSEQLRPVDLVRTVERAVTAVRDAAGASVPTLHLPREPLFLNCDAVRLEHALTHLLLSAHHHMASGESLHVKLLATPSPGDDEGSAPRAELTVRALGSQIPAAELGRIAARFQAAMPAEPNGRTKPAAMRIVRDVVHVRSGSIEGRSSPHGLAFRVEWPLRRESAPTVTDLR